MAPVSSFVFVRNICMLLQRCVCRGRLRAIATQLPYTAAGLFCAIFGTYGAGQKCRPCFSMPAAGVPRLGHGIFGKRRDPVLNFAESLCHVVFETVELKGSMWPRLVARLLSEHSSRFSSVDIGILGASKVRKTLITLNARCVFSLFVWGIVVWPVPNRMSPVPFLPEGELYNAPGIIFVSAIRGRGILRGLVLQQAGRRC